MLDGFYVGKGEVESAEWMIVEAIRVPKLGLETGSMEVDPRQLTHWPGRICMFQGSTLSGQPSGVSPGQVEPLW